ncbi:protein Nazo-like isoform X1 [Panulirus ornatus]|uniref:protein Nazo-like isoform X1 n=1 Tax=Panulirus ornatus TaxID=150431 RepID=UPI003A881E10
MPINTQEVLSVVEQLCEEENLRVAFKESLKGGAIAGSSTVIGGLLAGPLGLALGGAVGGLTAAFLSQGKFKSVASIIRNDLTPAQKERLANSVWVFLRNRSVWDLAEVSKLLCSPSVKLMLLEIVISTVFAVVGIIFQWRKKTRRMESLENPTPSSRA